MLPLLMLLLLTLASHAHGEYPAIRLQLTEKGLKYGTHVGAGWVADIIGNASIPDVKGGVRLGALGTVDYVLSRITVTRCDFPEPSVDFYQDTSLKTVVNGLSIAVQGRWNTHFGIIHDGGSFDLALFNIDITSVVQLGSDIEGRPSVTSLSCDATVGNARMDFHGGGSFIFQHFVNWYQNHIKGAIEEKICPAIEDHVADLEGRLAVMQVSFQVNSALVLDLPLTNSPRMDSSSLGLDLKGEFYSVQSHTDPPFKAQPFELPQQGQYMLSLGLSEFTVNSASYVYFSAKLLQASINDSMIPSSSPFHLNTSSFGTLIPQLPKLFPKMLMLLNVYARDVPMFSFIPDNVTLEFLGAVKAFAIFPNATLAPLFTLNTDSSFTGKIMLSEGKIKASMKLSNFSMTLAATEVGTFPTASLETVAKMGINVLVSKLNDKLAKGIPLPSMHHIQLVNPVLKVEKGFIAIASDAHVPSA